MRGPIGAYLLIYVAMVTVPLALGSTLLISPARAGNFLNEFFAIFPEVKRGDWLKRILYRVFGVGLIAMSVLYSVLIYRTVFGRG
jgi:hypothetical protein